MHVGEMQLNTTHHYLFVTLVLTLVLTRVYHSCTIVQVLLQQDVISSSAQLLAIAHKGIAST